MGGLNMKTPTPEQLSQVEREYNAQILGVDSEAGWDKTKRVIKFILLASIVPAAISLYFQFPVGG